MIGRKRTYEEACEDQKSSEPQRVTANAEPQEQVFSKHLLQIYYGNVVKTICPFSLHSHYLHYFCIKNKK